MLKTIGWLLLSLACAGLVGRTFAGDEKPKQQTRMLSAGSELWMLPEVGAVAVVKDGKLMFEMVSPAESRPKGYESVDIKQGDLIMMANGKKITGAKDIQAMYDSLAIGAELKLGIRRGEEMLIAAIKKADPATLPQRRMVIKGDGPGAGQGWASRQEHAIEIDDNARDVTPINGAGMIIGTLEKDIVVLAMLPSAKDILGDAAIQKGDKIIALQGTPVTSVEKFASDYEAIKIGEPVTITVNHAGKELKASFTKPEAVFRTIMKKD
ncbi:MAG: PDZ domain-containing protein [candidate division Zixibacteria bacterium]|nr:PDZ domain-containing protein [candidate division Zixibacteria bacterium]